MKKRVLCALFAAALLATSVMAGCSGGEASANNTPSSSQADDSKNDASKAEDTESQASSLLSLGSGTLAGLKATKVNSVSFEAKAVIRESAGFVYETDDGKFGVMPFDGSARSDAKYVNVNSAGMPENGTGYFTVRTSTDTANVNNVGLIDDKGNEILPSKYAFISQLNERYFKVITADKETTSKGDAVYEVEEELTLSTSLDNTVYVETVKKDEFTGKAAMYTGKWEVYDLKNKAMVKDAAGTKPRSLKALGQFIIFDEENNNEIRLNGSGSAITDSRTILSNGDYVLEINGKSAVYDSEDRRLFNFNSSEYSIYSFEDPYYVGRIESNNNFVLINEQGETVSAEIDGYISSVAPQGYISDEVLYKLDGTPMSDQRFTSIKADTVNKDACVAYKGSVYAVFDSEGNLIVSCNTDEDEIKGSDFKFFKGATSPYQCLNFGSGEYNIEGTFIEDWLVQQEAGKVYDIIDSRTGEKLLNSSYGKYDTCKTKNGKMYLYAYNSINGSTSYSDFDVYTVSING